MLSACLNGTVVPLADVKDEAFASGALGDGIAIEPTDGELVAPADGADWAMQKELNGATSPSIWKECSRTTAFSAKCTM